MKGPERNGGSGGGRPYCLTTLLRPRRVRTLRGLMPHSPAGDRRAVLRWTPLSRQSASLYIYLTKMLDSVMLPSVRGWVAPGRVAGRGAL